MGTNLSYQEYDDSCSQVYPAVDFHGLWSEHWPNGQLKYRGEFQLVRKRIGQHLLFWPNGYVRELSYWDDGWITGTAIRFNDDGSKECEIDYGEYGGRTRSWTERTYGVMSGQVMTVMVWRNGALVAEWTHPELRAIEKEIDFDRRIEDALQELKGDE